MKSGECSTAYEQYRNEQIAWASAEESVLILAEELIRLKDETGMDLFWDADEEEFLRDYLEATETVALG